MNIDVNRPKVVGLGELLWDVFPDGKRPGGAPANVAFQSQQLGGQGIVVSRVGADELGDELVQFLESKGLRTDAIQRDETSPTGRVTVSINAQNQPEYVIHEGVAWDFMEFDEHLQFVMSQVDAVCFGTLAQRNPVSRETIRKAVAATSEECLRVYDVNIRQQYFDNDRITQSLQLANVVKLNDEEVELLAPLLGLPVDESDFAQRLVEQFDLNLVCVTRGAKGCLIASPEGTVLISGEPVEVADTVGAGDAFTAGLIFGLLTGKSMEASGRFANRVGGLVASRHGAMPDLGDEFVELIKETF